MSRSFQKRFVFLRTFKMLQSGGPVPPLGTLYLASVLRARFKDRIDIKVLDTGITPQEIILREIIEFSPDFVGLSTLSCEADLLMELAAAVKKEVPDAVTIAGGPHATVAKEKLLKDGLIDIVMFGESEQTLPEFLDVSDVGGDLTTVKGIAFLQNGKPLATPERAPIKDLDSLPFPAWDMVDLNAYSEIPNWNGTLKEKAYAPILSSRGCPYGCMFCHNIFGKQVRKRSPQNLIAEIMELKERFGIKEFHIVDDVFNIDRNRVEQICNLLIENEVNASFSFPNGLRADLMDEDLVKLMQKAGTYKINYGFETASPKLQKSIGKNLDIEKAAKTFEATSDAGIITGAYFMFGLPSQSEKDMLDTIDFAADSKLDVGYFFKATAYPGSAFYDQNHKTADFPSVTDFADYHFFATGGSFGDVEESTLNRMILLAQQKFYLKPGRLFRGFVKAPGKLKYIRNLMNVFALILQSYLVKSLSNPKPEVET